MTEFKTQIPENLINAYKSTNFEIYSDPKFILKIDEFNPELKELFLKFYFSTGCFITAYNPKSVEFTDVENKSLQDALYKELKKSEYHVINGLGSDPAGQWDGEPSFFVMGITLSKAKVIGRKYKQNAIVWCDDNCIPDLIILR
jgi:hypothetical protein